MDEISPVIDAVGPTEFEQTRRERKLETGELFYLAFQAESMLEEVAENRRRDVEKGEVVVRINDEDGKRLYEKLKERYEDG